MRIIHLTTEFPPIIGGGLGVAVGGLAEASARAGMKVDVLLVREGEQRSYGLSVELDGPARHQGRSGLPASLQLFQIGWGDMIGSGVDLARELRPEVLHIHPVELWPIASAVRDHLKVPIVYTAHSLNVAEYEVGHEVGCAPLWQAQQELIRGADRVIALTASERSLLFQRCQEERGRVRVVGNGIEDCEAARSASSRDRRRASPVVLFAGRFVDRKGIRDLLAAIPRVLVRAPEARFVLVGGYGRGPDIEREWLPAWLYPYRDRIRFTGWLTPAQVADWYRAADILVIPSWYEPFGLVVLEGMLYGLPIAASKIGGPAAILDDGRTGLLFRAKDPGALSEALLTLITNEGLRQRIGAAAAREVRKKWLWSRIVRKIHAVYREALSCIGRSRHLEGPGA